MIQHLTHDSAKKIFVSYPSVEVGFALRLAADLRNRGVNLWMDRLEGIVGGEDWRDAIQTALNHCAALVAVITPEYVTSEYCRNELARANRLKRPIIPALVHTVHSTAWPIELERIQYIDFTSWRSVDGYRSSFQALMDLITERGLERIGQVPSTETQYLTRLIAELEARKGVIGHVPLAADAREPRDPSLTNEPRKGSIMESWGLDSPFALLEECFVDEDDPDSPVEYQPTPLANIQDALTRFGRFVMIGSPGTGKTTTLQRLTLEACRAHITNPRRAPLPLFLHLATWKQANTVEDFVRPHWKSLGFSAVDLIEMMMNGDVIVFLDGLNEAGWQAPELSKQLREWLHGRMAPKTVCITCRAEDYDSRLDLGLPQVKIQELDRTRIQQFAGSYLPETEKSTFLRRLESSDGSPETALEGLARNPFFLTALLVLHTQSPDALLSQNLGQLMQQLVLTLWERERLRNTRGWTPFAEVRSRLSSLASAMIGSDSVAFVSTDDALSHLREWPLLDALCSATLLEISEDRVRFYHALIQDYFAALAFPVQNLREILPPVQITNWRRRTTKWDHLLVIRVGLEKDAASIVNTIASEDPFLALHCLKRRSGEAATFQNVINALRDLSQDSDAQVRGVVTETFGGLACPEGTEVVLGLLWDENTTVRRFAAQALGKLSDPSTIPAILAALTEENETRSVRRHLTEAIGHMGGRAVDPLIRLLHDRDEAIRLSAASALRDLGSSAQEGLIRALRSKNADVSGMAAELLGGLGGPHVIAALADRLSDTRKLRMWKGERVCELVAEALAEIGSPQQRHALHASQPDRTHRAVHLGAAGLRRPG